MVLRGVPAAVAAPNRQFNRTMAASGAALNRGAKPALPVAAVNVVIRVLTVRTTDARLSVQSNAEITTASRDSSVHAPADVNQPGLLIAVSIIVSPARSAALDIELVCRRTLLIAAQADIANRDKNARATEGDA